jgi:6-phosphogluconolactonase
VTTPRVIVVDDQAALASEAASRISQAVAQAIARHGRAIVSLTGGRTARGIYAALASAPWRDRIDWSSLVVCWSDERHVAPTDPDSNYGMARDTLLDHVPIPPAQVYRMPGEIADPDEAAAAYARTLGALRAETAGRPFLADLSILALGDDGHVASIFPGSSVLQERERPVVAIKVPHLDRWRITLTPPALLDAERTIIVAAGAGKADALANVLTANVTAPMNPARWPAQLLRQVDERVDWLIDRSAAGRWPAAPPG